MATLTLRGKRGAGRVTLVDDADLPALSQYSWHLSPGGYARTYITRPGVRSTTIHLHQLLRDEHGGGYRDHINGDPLDNRRANLRPCTREENNRNRGSHRTSKTGLKGVSPFGKGWRAQIHVGRQQFYLGLYPHPMLAAIAYNAAATVLFGPFARLNDIDLSGLALEVARAGD